MQIMLVQDIYHFKHWNNAARAQIVKKQRVIQQQKISKKNRLLCASPAWAVSELQNWQLDINWLLDILAAALRQQCFSCSCEQQQKCVAIR